MAVSVSDPYPGAYLVLVHGWQTDGPDSEYTLFSWSFGPTAPAVVNMTVDETSPATLAGLGTVDVEWFGLDADTKYLGAVVYNDESTDFASTIMRIDTD